MIKRSRFHVGSVGRVRILIYLVLIVSVLVLGYLFLGKQSVDKGEKDFRFIENETPGSLIDNRGTIYDRNFKELAITLDRVSVYAKVRDVSPEEAANKLAPVLGVSQDTLKAKLKVDSYRVWLAKNISQMEEEAVAALKLTGISLYKNRVRFYPEKETAAHVLGFVGKNMGLAGVEHSYNSLLNTYGAVVPDDEEVQRTDQEQLAQPREHLVLTLDLKIQRILEKFVADQGGIGEGGKLAALLMECATGKIIGVAGNPSYDPNRFYKYSHEQLKNILAQPVLVPAQIKKILWDASLLQYRFELKKEILPWSIHSNPRGLGSQLQLWDRLGLNDPLEVDFVAGARDFSQYLHVGMDRGEDFDSVTEAATPLHILTAVNSLIIGGKKRVPHTIDRIARRDGQVFSLSTEAREETVDLLVAQEIQNLLKGQMTSGPLSSGLIQTDNLSFVVKNNVRQYERNRMLFSVIPKKNPRYLLFVFAKLPVFLPSPKETKSRSDLATASQKIILPMIALQEVMSNLSDMMSVEEKKEMNFESHHELDSHIRTNRVELESVFLEMPDLKGFSLRKSLRLLKDLKLEIQISGSGAVVEQKPQPGAQVKPGELCRLVLKPH